MASRKLRNKTRRLRGGGGCLSKSCATVAVAPTNLNRTLNAASTIMNKAKTARQKNKAEKKAESKLLKKQAEIHAREYANSEVKRLGITGNNSNHRDALYSLYMSAFNTKLTQNIFNGAPAAEGIDEFFDTFGKNNNFTKEEESVLMGDQYKEESK